jgi:hypothetical protein
MKKTRCLGFRSFMQRRGEPAVRPPRTEKSGSDCRLIIDVSQEAGRRQQMKKRELMNRRERLKLAARILRKRAYEGNSVTERFKSEYPSLTDIMQEMLVEAQAFLEMSDDEFESDFLSSMPYNSFKVLIFYYAVEELKKKKTENREVEKADNRSQQLSAAALQ